MKGRIYCIGVGPGDAELMTLKAVRIIKECDVIAYPIKDEQADTSVAFNIARQAVPDIAAKDLLPIFSPMVRDRKTIQETHERAVNQISSLLADGLKVAYLTLGDPMIYCTYTSLAKLLSENGYETDYVSGVTSFCAAAARLGTPIADRDETLTILPGVYDVSALKHPGRHVIMKSAGKMHQVKDELRALGKDAMAVENCGMQDEKVYRSISEIPDDAGYFTVILPSGK